MGDQTRKGGEIKSEDARTLLIRVTNDTNETISILKESILKGGNEKLHPGAVANNKGGNAGDVWTIESGVDFIQHKEGRRMNGMNGEEKSQSSDRFLSS